MKNRWVSTIICALATITWIIISIAYMANELPYLSLGLYGIFIFFLQIMFICLSVGVLIFNILMAIKKNILFGIIVNLIFYLLICVFLNSVGTWYLTSKFIRIMFYIWNIVFILGVGFGIVDLFIYCRNNKNMSSTKDEETNGVDPYKELTRLKALYDDGTLTEEMYNQKRKKYLDML